MAEINRSDGPGGAPPANKTLLVIAGVCLALPIVALLWVNSYTRETPRLFGFPFFFWYQFLWVFICAVLTYAAHRLVLAARKPTGSGHRAGDSPTEGPRNGEGDR